MGINPDCDVSQHVPQSNPESHSRVQVCNIIKSRPLRVLKSFLSPVNGYSVAQIVFDQDRRIDIAGLEFVSDS